MIHTEETPKDVLGAHAVTPSAFTWAGWIDVLKRVWRKNRAHGLGMMSASIAFYGAVRRTRQR